jgi:hypothetical protein
MSKVRKAGFYWVVYGGRLQVAENVGISYAPWRILGRDRYLSDNDFQKIYYRITEPKEKK